MFLCYNRLVMNIIKLFSYLNKLYKNCAYTKYLSAVKKNYGSVHLFEVNLIQGFSLGFVLCFGFVSG